MQLRNAILGSVGLLALVAGAALACPNHARSTGKSAAVLTPPASHAAVVAWKPRPWTPAPAVAAAQGMRVAIDPVDGAMGMPAPDAFSNELRIEDDAPVATMRRDNGSVRATLDERFAEFAVVTLGADGKPSWTCVHGPQGAAQFMKKPVVRPAPAPGTVWEEK